MAGGGFWQAYETIHAVEPFLELRRPVYQLLWCLEYARSTEEHLANSQGVCKELGVPIIQHFS